MPLKRPNKQTQPPPPQYLFKINCFSLKAVVTSLERFSNPAEHNSVELFPQETAALALTGSDPGQNRARTFVRASLRRQTAEPAPPRATQNSSVPPLPFSSLSTWGCSGDRKSSSLSLCALAEPQGGGEGLISRRGGAGGSAAEPGSRAMGRRCQAASAACLPRALPAGCQALPVPCPPGLGGFGTAQPLLFPP